MAEPGRVRRPSARAGAGVPRTLAVDIGGSGIKASVLDADGAMLVDRRRIETPVGSSPAAVVGAVVRLVLPLPAFDRVSVGFPGVVRRGRVLTAPNLGHDGWRGFDLARVLRRRLGKPVRLANDADMQGLAVIRGKGVELVITLGTGFGTSLYRDGWLAPHLELAHHPFRKGETYEEQLGNRARRKTGNTRWNRRLRRAIAMLRTLVSFDRLYLGGGNARKVTLELDPDTRIVSNDAGIRGGVFLWAAEPGFPAREAGARSAGKRPTRKPPARRRPARAVARGRARPPR